MRVIRHGYLDMGRPRVPPLPLNILIQDRVTGTFYHLTHTGTPGSLSVSLSATLPAAPDKVIFGPFEGPYVSGRARLYVSSGALQSELAPEDLRQLRVLTRRGNERTFLEITVPGNWKTGDPLTFTQVEV